MKIKERRFLDTPTASAHAATVEFFNGHPVFAWFGGYREGAEDVAIYINNLNGDNKTIILGNKDRMPRWNPILYNHEGRLYLFEKAGTFCDRWQTFIHDITDWGEAFSEERARKFQQVLPAGLNGPVKTRPVPETGLSEDGDIICGSSVETTMDWTSYFEHYRVVDGKWVFEERSKPISPKEKVAFKNMHGQLRASLGVLQPAMWFEDDIHLHSFFRSSRGLKNLYYLKHDRNPNKELEPIMTNLPNPNSGVDVVYHNDELYLVSNPSSQARIPLTIQKLKHEGDGSFDIYDEIEIRSGVEKEDQRACITGELSYPYMIEHDNELHLVYTYGRSKIEYVVIEL